MNENKYIIPPVEPDDRVRALIRTAQEEREYEFRAAYLAWVNCDGWYALRETAWEKYCVARDRLFSKS